MPNHWYPNGAGILLDTIDGTLDLSDISWQAVAPCGCVSGVAMAATGPDDLLITPEQAGMSFAGSKAEYEQDRERGFTYRPREHKAACEGLALKCEHVPRWGYAPPPKPEGMTWAAVHCLGAHPKLKHLVPVAAVEATKARDMTVLNVKPLCGGKAAYWWKDEWYATDGKVECKRCIAAAEKKAVPA